MTSLKLKFKSKEFQLNYGLNTIYKDSQGILIMENGSKLDNKAVINVCDCDSVLLVSNEVKSEIGTLTNLAPCKLKIDENVQILDENAKLIDNKPKDEICLWQMSKQDSQTAENDFKSLKKTVNDLELTQKVSNIDEMSNISDGVFQSQESVVKNSNIKLFSSNKKRFLRENRQNIPLQVGSPVKKPTEVPKLDFTTPDKPITPKVSVKSTLKRKSRLFLEENDVNIQNEELNKKPKVEKSEIAYKICLTGMKKADLLKFKRCLKKVKNITLVENIGKADILIVINSKIERTFKILYTTSSFKSKFQIIFFEISNNFFENLENLNFEISKKIKQNEKIIDEKYIKTYPKYLKLSNEIIRIDLTELLTKREKNVNFLKNKKFILTQNILPKFKETKQLLLNLEVKENNIIELRKVNESFKFDYILTSEKDLNLRKMKKLLKLNENSKVLDISWLTHNLIEFDFEETIEKYSVSIK